MTRVSNAISGDARVETGPDDSLSRRIAVARVISILGIVYVHAWTGLNINELRAQGAGGQSLLYWGLIEYFGRSSVPLLSIISGWLVAASVSRRSYVDFVRRKAGSLLLPMILWNLIAISIIVPLAKNGIMYAPAPGWGMPMLNEVLHLTAPAEINVQNAFLRDMFVCMLLAPFLVRAPKAVLFIALGLVFAWSVEGVRLYILLRPQILLFFLIGIISFRFRLDRVMDRVSTWPLALAFLLLGGVKTWISFRGQFYMAAYPECISVLDNLLRLIAAICFWKAADFLSRSQWSGRLIAIEPYCFLFFCSHVLLIWLIGPSIGPLFGRFGDSGYPLFLLLQPFIMFAGSIMIGLSLGRVSPTASRLLSGGRL